MSIEEQLRNSLNFQGQIIDQQSEVIVKMKLQMQQLNELLTRYERVISLHENTMSTIQEMICIPIFKLGPFVLGRRVKYQKRENNNDRPNKIEPRDTEIRKKSKQ